MSSELEQVRHFDKRKIIRMMLIDFQTAFIIINCNDIFQYRLNSMFSLEFFKRIVLMKSFTG